ncbi:MAG: GntR family transcriptional regulator [Chloroflexota bacterium]|nr:GntR family transcriptional regulator [Chloroflexota bacterium]
MPALDRTSPLPLWAQLAGELRRRLLEGELGGRLPPEARLAADYEVSRQTVREAIRRLREAGLLTAERGRGTFVRTLEAAVPPVAGAGSLLAALEAARPGGQVRVRVLDRVAEPRAAARLGLPAAAGLIHLERLWTVDGLPVAHDRVWLPGAAAAPLLDVDFRAIPLHAALDRWCGLRVDAGFERIGLTVPSGEPRRLLGFEKRQPVLAVERLGCAGDRPVEWGETLVRGDRCALVVEWSPAGRGCAVDPQPPGTAPRAAPA